MTQGAVWRFDPSDGAGTLTDANLNALDMGSNVYQTPGQLLQVSVSPIKLIFMVAGAANEIDYAGVVGQAVTASTTTKFYIDGAGVLNSTTGAYPSLQVTQHFRLATVVANATTITSITDDRPKGLSTFNQDVSARLGAKVKLDSGSIAVASLTIVPVVFSTANNASELWDYGDIHDLVTNPARMTVPAGGAGLWRCNVKCRWDTGSAAYRQIGVKHYNSSSVEQSESIDYKTPHGSAVPVYQAFVTEFEAADGDYFEMIVATGGPATNISGLASGDYTSFWCERVSA